MNRKRAALVAAVILVVSGLGIVAYAVLGPGAQQNNVVLPPGCVKPPEGFLIVADYNGFNDSAGHGVPANPWPVVNVQQGANVTIVVCNADTEAHGFQVSHYFDGNIVTLAPGQVTTVMFVANEAGTFRIYCSIVCGVHWAMLSGELRVA